MSIQFGAVTLYQSQNKNTMDAHYAQHTDTMDTEGLRQVMGRHEMLEITGPDQLAMLQIAYGFELPEALQKLPIYEVFDQVDNEPQYAYLREQIEALDEKQNRDEFPKTLSTIMYEYYGLCKGRGVAADGTPVKVVNLDTQA